MVNYIKLAAMAEKMLSDSGRSVTVRNVTGGTYNPVTDTNSGEVITNTAVVAVLLPYDSSKIDGTSIRKTDLECYIRGSIEVTTDSIIIDGTDELSVVSVNKTNPGNTVLLYIAQLRK